ncbi:hypothetical protein EDC01DRAFT_635349 [Geopyxis carbonaria]|nr:hypothetical protein EDC01DRAFT_635349 [Geopyxis carbonaria]
MEFPRNTNYTSISRRLSPLSSRERELAIPQTEEEQMPQQSTVADKNNLPISSSDRRGSYYEQSGVRSNESNPPTEDSGNISAQFGPEPSEPHHIPQPKSESLLNHPTIPTAPQPHPRTGIYGQPTSFASQRQRNDARTSTHIQNSGVKKATSRRRHRSSTNSFIPTQLLVDYVKESELYAVGFGPSESQRVQRNQILCQKIDELFHLNQSSSTGINSIS